MGSVRCVRRQQRPRAPSEHSTFASTVIRLVSRIWPLTSTLPYC